MSDTTNIRPINEAVGRTYGMDTTTANARFHVGRLYNLRGRIAHEGALIGMPPMILRYIDALYRDVLLDQLAFPPRRYLEAVLNNPDFDASYLFPGPRNGTV
jgi:hypothetical protein